MGARGPGVWVVNAKIEGPESSPNRRRWLDTGVQEDGGIWQSLMRLRIGRIFL